MSTRREVILSWLREKRQTWRLCYLLGEAGSGKTGNDSNLLIVFYVQIMPDDFVMQLHRF
ncbi:putative general secretion pathway protein A [Escherichia coli]|nr:putative general secretion pathway protein A [Escherichia coli]